MENGAGYMKSDVADDFKAIAGPRDEWAGHLASYSKRLAALSPYFANRRVLSALARGTRLALAVVTLALSAPVITAAMGIFVRIEEKIPAERFDIVRERIAPLMNVPADIIRYFEVKDEIMVLRLEDKKFCRDGQCVTIIANGALSSYVAIYARNEAFMPGPAMSLSSNEEDGDRGSVIAFQAGPSGAADKEIEVFFSHGLVVVLP
jgi:hypothetical protein